MTGKIEISGIHLYRISDDVVVRAEIRGQWVEVIREQIEGEFSHCVEPDGMNKARDAYLESVLSWLDSDHKES